MLHIPGEHHVLVKMGPFQSRCSSSEVLTLKHLSLDCAPVKSISLGHQCHWSRCVPLENGLRLWDLPLKIILMIDQPQHLGPFFDVIQSQDTGTPLCRHKLCPAKYCSHGALQSLDLHMQTQCQVGSDRRRVHHPSW